jgi:hypothetical protein
MENVVNNAIEKSEEIVTNLNKEPGCKTCKNNKLSNSQVWMVVLSAFILITSVYGTIQLVKDIASFFK